MDDQIVLNLEQVPKELSLILELLKDQHNEFNQIDHELFKDIDWDLFIDLSLHHRLYPILYRKAKQCNDLIPATVTKTLYQYYQRNTFQMLHLAGEMENISKLFNENQVRVLFLKGPVLAHDLYGGLSLRTSNDLDVLVPFSDLEKLDDILISVGYIKDDYIKSVLSDWKWRNYHFIYYHPQKNIKLEIHWRLHEGPSKEPDFNTLWDRRAKSNLSNQIYLLEKNDLFMYLVLHGARHGWSRLRWLVDINQLIQKDIDLRLIDSLFKKYSNRSVAGQALILSNNLFHLNFTKGMQPLLTTPSKLLAQNAIYYIENMINIHDEPLRDDISKYHKNYLFSLKSFRQKIIFLLSFLYPYPEDAQTLPLPKKLHFLYFPLRPFLWGWRKTRKHAIS